MVHCGIYFFLAHIPPNGSKNCHTSQSLGIQVILYFAHSKELRSRNTPPHTLPLLASPRLSSVSLFALPFPLASLHFCLSQPLFFFPIACVSCLYLGAADYVPEEKKGSDSILRLCGSLLTRFGVLSVCARACACVLRIMRADVRFGVFRVFLSFPLFFTRCMSLENVD